MTIKIAHIADTHLGYKQYGLIEREEDFYDTFRNIIDDIIDKQVDYVIHAGDLFENPKPPIKALLVAQESFLKLMQHNIPVYTIAGNHDFMQRKNTITPQKLYENENFHIISFHDNTIPLTENVVLCGLPYISKNYEENIKEILKQMTENIKDYKWKILMLHGSIRKYFDFEPEFELDTIPTGYDYYAMGHLHGRIMDTFKGGKLSYPGSTEIRNKDELPNYWKNGKGYNLITITDNQLSAEYINIKLERDFIDKSIFYPKIDEELEKLEKIIKEKLEKNPKKPIVYLTIKEGDFDRTEVSTKINDKLGKLTLTLRIKYEPTDTSTKLLENLDENDLSPEYIIKEKLNEYGEDISTLGVSLYKNLSNHEIGEARKISDKYYHERFQNED